MHSLISQMLVVFLLPPSLTLARSLGHSPPQWTVRLDLMAPLTLGRASACSADVWIVADMPWGCSPAANCYFDRRIFCDDWYFVARVWSVVEFSSTVVFPPRSRFGLIGFVFGSKAVRGLMSVMSLSSSVCERLG